MARREFLHWLTGSAALGALSACLPLTPELKVPQPNPKVRAICFDLFTLFDPRSVVTVAKTIVPERAAALCEAWRLRQFEYSWLHVAANRYLDFRSVTEEALLYAEHASSLSLSPEQRRTLIAAYSQLELWPDARQALLAWQQAGLRLAPLSNYTPEMLAELLDHAGVSRSFEAQISTHRARTFKPDPRAYALGPAVLGLAREEIVFAAFGGWDAAGAKWFGFPTFWVNRLGLPGETLAPGPDASGPSLNELDQFVRARSG